MEKRRERLKAIYLKVLIDGYKSLEGSFNNDHMTPGFRDIFNLLNSDLEVNCISFKFKNYKLAMDELSVLQNNHYILFTSYFSGLSEWNENTELITDYFYGKYNRDMTLWWPLESIQDSVYLFEFKKGDRFVPN